MIQIFKFNINININALGYELLYFLVMLLSIVNCYYIYQDLISLHNNESEDGTASNEVNESAAAFKAKERQPVSSKFL